MITVNRNDGMLYEDLVFIISDSNREEIMTNENLINGRQQLLKFGIQSADKIEINARNLYNSTRNTFLL